jgi:hypothetical protein
VKRREVGTAPCACGHDYLDHGLGEGPCRSPECECQGFRVAGIAEDVGEAIANLHLGYEAFTRFPIRAVDELVGGMPDGDVGFICAFSGNGKTTFVSTMTDTWLRDGVRVYVMPLESRPATWLTHLACKRHDPVVHAGDVLTGESRKWLGWPKLRGELAEEIVRLGKTENLFVNSVDTLTDAGMDVAMREAAEWGADVFLVDHIDHTDAGGDYNDSVRLNTNLPRRAQKYGLRVVATSQLNNDVIRGDKIARYQPPLPNHVYMGAHKRMVCAWMIGLYRPLMSTVTPKELQAIRKGEVEARAFLRKNCMGVSLMKHRHYGENEGDARLLEVMAGRVYDPEQPNQPAPFKPRDPADPNYFKKDGGSVTDAWLYGAKEND